MAPLAPHTDTPRAEAALGLSRSVRATDPPQLETCTHRAVFHSSHQVPGLGWHIPRQEKRGMVRVGPGARAQAAGVWPGKDVFPKDSDYVKFIPSECIERLDSQEISAE